MRTDPPSGKALPLLLGRQRRVHIRIDPEYLVQARDFEDGADGVLHPGNGEHSAVFFHALHCLDQYRQSGTIDVTDARQINDQLWRLVLDHLTEGNGNTRRDVQIDFAFERKDVRLIRGCRVAIGHTLSVPRYELSPSESSDDFVDIRQIIKQKIRFAGGKLQSRPRAGGDGDGPRAECFTAFYIAGSIADYVDLLRGKFVAVLLLRSGSGKRAESVAIMMVIGKSSKLEEMPNTVVL